MTPSSTLLRALTRRAEWDAAEQEGLLPLCIARKLHTVHPPDAPCLIEPWALDGYKLTVTEPVRTSEAVLESNALRCLRSVSATLSEPIAVVGVVADGRLRSHGHFVVVAPYRTSRFPERNQVRDVIVRAFAGTNVDIEAFIVGPEWPAYMTNHLVDEERARSIMGTVRPEDAGAAEFWGDDFSDPAFVDPSRYPLDVVPECYRTPEGVFEPGPDTVSREDANVERPAAGARRVRDEPARIRKAKAEKFRKCIRLFRRGFKYDQIRATLRMSERDVRVVAAAYGPTGVLAPSSKRKLTDKFMVTHCPALWQREDTPGRALAGHEEGVWWAVSSSRSTREAHEAFCEKYPEHRVSLSTFIRQVRDLRSTREHSVQPPRSFASCATITAREVQFQDRADAPPRSGFVFVAVIDESPLVFVASGVRLDAVEWCRLHTRMVEQFGGVPHSVALAAGSPEMAKRFFGQAASSREEHRESRRVYDDMATHFGFKIEGKPSMATWSHFVSGVTSGSETLAQLRDLIEANVRRVTRPNVERDAPLLQPRPSTKFLPREYRLAKVHHDGTVDVARGLYSVHPKYIGHDVWARKSGGFVEIEDEHGNHLAKHREVGERRRSVHPEHVALDLTGDQVSYRSYLVANAREYHPAFGFAVARFLDSSGYRPNLRSVQSLIHEANAKPRSAVVDLLGRLEPGLSANAVAQRIRTLR